MILFTEGKEKRKIRKGTDCESVVQIIYKNKVFKMNSLSLGSEVKRRPTRTSGPTKPTPVLPLRP